jgi:hypothetical protein
MCNAKEQEQQQHMYDDMTHGYAQRRAPRVGARQRQGQVIRLRARIYEEDCVQLLCVYVCGIVSCDEEDRSVLYFVTPFGSVCVWVGGMCGMCGCGWQVCLRGVKEVRCV